MTTRATVLFICEHNAGRSQLGAHLLAHYAGDRIIATSARISPADQISPVVVVEALSELGIDTSTARTRKVTADDLATAVFVVTMKPGLTLPGLIAGQLIEWQLPDPDTWGIDGVRDLRDRIHTHTRDLAEQIK